MHRLANPTEFKNIQRTLLPLLIVASVGFLAWGLVQALWLSPADYQQGDFVRIMYIHVPAAWLGLGLYVAMAIASGFALVQRAPLAGMMANAIAPVGATFTAICLITGMIWGKPMWGAYWVWDARLTSMLVLWFMYLGFIALCDAFENSERGQAPASILALIGVVNVPIVKFSVDWWHTLHQPASVFKMQGSTLHPEMLSPLLSMAFGCACVSGVLVLLGVQTRLHEKRIQRRQTAEKTGR